MLGFGTPVAGQQFEYGFDDIGNRTSTRSGGDSAGSNLRAASYTPNALNQCSSRDVPGYLNVVGIATPAATVSVNNSPVPYRRREYFWSELSVNNSSAADPEVEVTAVNGGSSATPDSGHIFVPPATESFTHDYDGNLAQDGRWVYTWDAENRLVKMESLSTGPAGSRRLLEFEYDARGRRIRKKTTDLGTAAVLADLKMTYDSWNLLAEMNVSGGALVRGYVWCLDLSGTLEGAGGVGGLLFVKDTAATHTAAYDGNGNVTGLANMSSGAISASYEYGPFGEAIRSSGDLAAANPFRFSTKYQDDETGFLYYGFRYYNPSTGRWLNRDPITERGGANLYGFVGNNPIQFVDAFGLRAIPFSFNAFINGKRRGYWHDEPGTFGLGIRQFSADDRDFGEFDSSKRNARVFSIGTIESKLIGAASKGGASGRSNNGDSHKRVRRFPSIGDIIGIGHGVDTAWDYETKQAPLSGGDAQVEDLSPCKTKVSFSASAAYPFGPFGFDSLSGLTPNINYNVTFIFEVTAKNQVTVTLTGSHNRFPDYEGYADGNNFYQYSSSWSGPNHANLGLTWRNIPSGTKHIINNIEVPACCPSSNK